VLDALLRRDRDGALSQVALRKDCGIRGAAAQQRAVPTFAALTIRSAQFNFGLGSAAAVRQSLAPQQLGILSMPPNEPAAPSSLSGGRRSGKPSVLPQARNTASPRTTAVAILAGQPPMCGPFLIVA
jgi:hypothetical protein